MPKVDESLQERETYGNAGGWSERRAVLPEGQSPQSVVAPKASPAPSADDGASSSEAVEPQEPVSSEPASPPSTAAPEPEAEAEVPFHKHPRWIERQQEVERLRQERDESRRLAELALQKIQVYAPPASPAEDPWKGLVDHADPATAQFWTTQKRLLEHERRLAKQETVQELAPVIEAGRAELARLNTERFREKNPAIKPGSEDERLIVAYMGGQVDGVFHPLESAKRNALFDRLESENKSLKSKQASIPQKRAAASSEASAGIPATAGLPGKPKSASDRASEVADKGGGWMEIAKTFFGG